MKSRKRFIRPKFRTRYDLVQIAEVDQLFCSSLLTSPGDQEAAYQGGDYNASGGITSADLAAFMADWGGEQSGADINRDEVIDVQDVADFADLYANP